MRRLPVLLLAGLLALAGPALGADEAEEQVRALGGGGPGDHAEVLAAWAGRTPAERVGILRRALASKDVAVSTLAAEGLGSAFLDAGELRVQMQRLLARPLSTFESATTRQPFGLGDDVRPWGSPDVVPFFEHVVADTTGAFEDVALDSWHRVLHPHHVAGLVPLLDRGGPKVFRSVLWHIAMCGEFDHEDRHRAEVARGLLYGLRRLRAERAGVAIPELGAEPVDVVGLPGGGLPAAFVELVEAYYPHDDSWQVRLDADGPPGDLQIRSVYFWLRRWARDLVPAPGDLPFLTTFAATTAGSDVLLRRWALGHMAAMPGPAGLDRVRTWAQGDDLLAAQAAAALAGRGETARFLELLDGDGEPGRAPLAPEVRDLLAELLWAVDRPRAREACVQARLADGEPESGARMWLDAQARFQQERFDGIDITADDMAWISDALWERGAPTTTLALFHHGATWPQGLTPARAQALLARLEDAPGGFWEERDPQALGVLLAHLEVQDAAGLVALLHTWVRTQPDLRSEVLQWLARLGDTRHARAIVEDAVGWEPHERLVLARVHDPVVRDFLQEQAASDDPEVVAPAVLTLLVQAGLPERLAQGLVWSWGNALDTPPLPGVLRRLRAGELADAVWLAAQQTEVSGWGLVQDPRARDALGRLREARHEGRHLQATLGLAIAGDAAATAALRSFLKDDRLWMIEDLPDEVWSCLPATWIVEHWLDRLDSNCCLGWRAMVALHSIFPTIPYDDGFGGAGTRRTRAWIQEQAFRPSRLLDGLVPAPR